jgi:hypothetical protein
MSLEQISRIRTLVQHMREQDDSGQLRNLLEVRAQHLHGSIKLPELQSAGMLADFVIRYIEQVPNFIEAIADIALEAGIYPRVEPLLSIACDYFLSPPDLINGHNKLESLLDEAYLAHRLLEEVNDRFIGYCGVPLAPMDMTRANIIAHELIGEPFANELDQAVLFSAELLLNQYRFTGRNFQRYISAHKTEGWAKEFSRWPCLTDDVAIEIEFGNYETLVTH